MVLEYCGLHLKGLMVLEYCGLHLKGLMVLDCGFHLKGLTGLSEMVCHQSYLLSHVKV
jgi:outer membrane lipopolysaccharide assembly protein LptE/RlpB